MENNDKIYHLLGLNNEIKNNNPGTKQKDKFSLLFYNNVFIKEIEKIRINFDIPKNGFDKKEGAADAVVWHRKVKKNSFDKIINELLIKINASDRWKEPIEYFILFNDQKPYHLFPEPFTFYIKMDKNRVLHLIMEVFPNTSLEDIKKKWPEIEKNKQILFSPNQKIKDKEKQKSFLILDTKKGITEKRNVSLLLRDRTINNLNKYIKIYKLKQSGKTYKEIAKMEEIKKLYIGKIVTYNEIQKDLDRFRSYIKNTYLS